MGIKIEPKNLLSRIIRFNAGEGRSGGALLQGFPGGIMLPARVREINFLNRLSRREQQGGVLDFLWNTAQTLLGFTGQILRFTAFSASAVWGWVVGRVEQLKAFNWNATDRELQQLIKNQNLMLASIWGGLVGQGVGWLAGIGVGYGIGVVCPVVGGSFLANAIAGQVTAEALEELLQGLKLAVRSTAGVAANYALINGYIQFRRLLKAAPLAVLDRLFPGQAIFIKQQWGAEGGPDLSFNAQMETAVERIDNPLIQTFVEEMLEESWESFIEAGFIITQELDEAFQQARVAATKQFGSPRTVEIELDRNNAEAEKIRFQQVPQQLLKFGVQTTLNQYRLIHNRDLGMVMGLPVEEYLRAKPQSLRIVINMFSVKEPPFYRTQNNDFQWATITIPDLERTALDWEKIKLAVGGANGYMYGSWRANATLNNGRSMAIYAASASEAEERMKALLNLTSAKMLTLSITQEKREAERVRRPRLYKRTVRVYPGFFTILNREEMLNPERGRPSTSGNYRDKKVKIPLWTRTAPANFTEVVRTVLRRGF